MHTYIQPQRHTDVSTDVGPANHVYKLCGLLVSLSFTGVSTALLYALPFGTEQAIAGMIAGGGIVAGIMLGLIPWSQEKAWWLDVYGVALALLIALLVLYSGAATSPFASLFFLATACVRLSSHRRSAPFITVMIAFLHLLPLIYSSASPQSAVQVLFSLPVHIVIALVGHFTMNRLAMQRQVPSGEEFIQHRDVQPIRDQLTGLHTGTVLEQHLHKTQMTPSAVGVFSLVLIGIDHWEALCEKHGRRSGDDIIRQIAVILQSHSRSSDIPARYDKHTFLLIFPGASAEIAMRLSERLRIVLEQHRFWTPDSPTRLAINVSLGISAYPQDGSTSHELAQAGFQRMRLLQQAHEAPAGAVE